MVPPLITLEEHFFSTAVGNALHDKHAEQFLAISGLETQLTNLDDVRLADMEKGKVSLQVISHGPGTLSPQQAHDANEQLAAAIQKHPTRFAGFAALAVKDPKAAAEELERAVKQHGFVGALIDCHVNGKYYDGDAYDVLWSKFQELDVPCYIHPAWPSDDMEPRYTGNFTTGASKSLGASGWGWHNEVALHVLRLHASGKFDKFPKLKIIIGHFGEMIPFMLARIEKLSVRWGKIKPFKQVYDENIWITTSGVWSLDPVRTILANTKIDHILYSVDYPFEKNENGLKWIEELEKSGLVTKEQLEAIAYGNSERLLRVKAPARQ
ncbi:amidohydrolase 2 [Teratosphaeria nubilosa]|uniref:Amidohydrolase 2 n=1 Tax=Teratosphaeria nubilosa TaxID=161662 RepID=A0A6G1LCV8_9PEZI|nr:amidohydrolase 2 [Teratosphaeria nubilosa]